MPLIKVSGQQLDAARRLYEATTAFIDYCIEKEQEWPVGTFLLFMDLFDAVSYCKEEYDKYGN